MLVALAGGVGAARFSAWAGPCPPPSDITAIVNVGDDTELHGLHISPDLDTVLYTLAGAINAETGWGLTGESWTVMEALEKLGGLDLVPPGRQGSGHPFLPHRSAWPRATP